MLTEVSSQFELPGVLHVAGRAQVFEATVSVRVKSLDGRIIVQGATMASHGAPEWGEFSVDLLYPPPPQGQTAVLEVFEESPRDGSPQSLVSVAVSLRASSELNRWQTFLHPTYRFQMRFPADWYVNQSASNLVPATTRFSTYKAGDVQVLGDLDAEVWVSIAEMPSVAEMEALESKGYRKRRLILQGYSAVRYTEQAPRHGLYDAVYVWTGYGEYRIHLSAASHGFDGVFALMLSTFTQNRPD